MRLLLASLLVLLVGRELVAPPTGSPSPPLDPLGEARANPRNRCEAELAQPDPPYIRAAQAAQRREFEACSFDQLVSAIAYLGMDIRVPADYVTWECGHNDWLHGTRLCQEFDR